MRLLAAFLPVTAVLYIGAEALDPRGTDQVATNTATALRLLPIASARSSQLYLSGFAVGVVAYIYFASEYIAPVVMGFALWRGRRVPRWLAVLFTVGLKVAESTGAIGPKVVL